MQQHPSDTYVPRRVTRRLAKKRIRPINNTVSVLAIEPWSCTYCQPCLDWAAANPALTDRRQSWKA